MYQKQCVNSPVNIFLKNILFSFRSIIENQLKKYYLTSIY